LLRIHESFTTATNERPRATERVPPDRQVTSAAGPHLPRLSSGAAGLAGGVDAVGPLARAVPVGVIDHHLDFIK
jgi:hypothetical protein